MAALTPAEDTLQRVRCEFIEMPGLRLTHAQAQRLWGLDDAVCTDVLQALIDARFLHRHSDGTYARVPHGSAPFRMAKADRLPRRADYRQSS